MSLNLIRPKILSDPRNIWTQILWSQNFIGPTIWLFWHSIFLTQHFFVSNIYLNPSFFWIQNLFWPTMALDPKLFWTQYFCYTNFFVTHSQTQNFCGPKILSNPKVLMPKKIRAPKFLWIHNFRKQNFVPHKFFIEQTIFLGNIFFNLKCFFSQSLLDPNNALNLQFSNPISVLNQYFWTKTFSWNYLFGHKFFRTNGYQISIYEQKCT